MGKTKKLHVEMRFPIKDFPVEKFREVIMKEKLSLVYYKQDGDYIFAVFEILHKELKK